MAQEVLYQHEGELAPQLEEADRFDSGLLSEQDLRAQVEMHSEPHGHHIEIKEAHACGVDCPEHGDHDHEDEHSHEQRHHHEVDHKHAIARKPAEHACAADCPEHGNIHNHEEPHSHHGHTSESHKVLGHHIESKAHACSADCPEHNNNHEDMHIHERYDGHQSHPESRPQHNHHIVSKPHACGVDCPEHGAVHIYDSAEKGREELGYDDALAHQGTEEAIRKSHGVEAQAPIVEPSTPGHNSEAIHERMPKKAAAEEALLEAEHTRQNELQVPEQQPEKESSIAHLSAVSEASLASTSLAEYPVEPPLAFDVVEMVETQSEVETLHDEIARNTEFTANMQLTEAEVVSSIETPVIPGFGQAWFSYAQELSDKATPIMHAEGFDDVASIEAVEPLGNTGIARVELPVLELVEFEQFVEANEDTQEVGLSNMPAALVAVPGQTQVEQGLMGGTEQMAESFAELVGRRVEAVTEHISTDAPLRAKAIEKTLRALTELQIVPGDEKHTETSRQLLCLLQLLGYENPAQTLKAYMHQYGIDFVSELQAKLLELLSQGRAYESLSASSPSSTATLSGDTSVLGMLVLVLARVRGHLLAAGGI